MTLAAPTRQHPDAGAQVLPIPPPLYYLAAFGAGIALRTTGTALNFGTGAVILAAGGSVATAGIGLAVAGIAQGRRARTTIVPHRPVTVLLTGGVYRISRNPMYTGLTIAYLGATLLTGSWWPLITLPAALLAVRVLVIGPEERYLTARFGPTYLDYRSHTRRWIGLSSPPDDAHPTTEQAATPNKRRESKKAP